MWLHNVQTTEVIHLINTHIHREQQMAALADSYHIILPPLTALCAEWGV